MIQLHPSRTPDMIAAALAHMHTQLGMPTRACESWGPSTRVQTDFAGQPIQQYLTMLVRVTGGRYLLVRHIVDLDRISRRVPLIHELAEKEARWWISNLELEAVPHHTESEVA
ncbi:hypothetical protein NA78x_002240 [Anatilimnocola sp. NA78]|uniref:hypothetical protein n=1 Tax=Anatilimnocola sp. NA78 TaxID=3415683 RepID=UPI003CE477E8